MKKKEYTKTHTNAKAAENHARKIKARGGVVTKTGSKGKIKLIYTFK
jgi:hypothetical protein